MESIIELALKWNLMHNEMEQPVYETGNHYPYILHGEKRTQVMIPSNNKNMELTSVYFYNHKYIAYIGET